MDSSLFIDVVFGNPWRTVGRA